jgi:hypothetical protein
VTHTSVAWSKEIEKTVEPKLTRVDVLRELERGYARSWLPTGLLNDLRRSNLDWPRPSQTIEQHLKIPRRASTHSSRRGAKIEHFLSSPSQTRAEHRHHTSPSPPRIYSKTTHPITPAREDSVRRIDLASIGFHQFLLPKAIQPTGARKRHPSQPRAIRRTLGLIFVGTSKQATPKRYESTSRRTGLTIKSWTFRDL